MFKFKYVVLFFCLFLAGHLRAQDVVATTSVLASVLNDIGKDKIETAVLIPAGSCPGHFDVKAGHIMLIEKSGILFAHGFEGYLERIVSSVQRKGFTPFLIEHEGSWLVPETQKEIYRKTTRILSDLFPSHANFFTENMENAESAMESAGVNVKKLIRENNLAGLPVISNSHIKEMLEFLGFNVVFSYGRKEDMTPSLIKRIIDEAKANDVRLVIDNLQAGPDTGRVIAEHLKIPHVNVSNFPDVLPGTPTLMDTLYENTKRIIHSYGAGNKTS